MGEVALRFLLFNLGVSVLSGLVMVVLILGLTRFLRIRDARTRNSLYGLALLKATLVMSGIALVVPFPQSTWQRVNNQALSVRLVGPWLLLWVGVLLAGGWWLRKDALRRAPRDLAKPDVLNRVNASVQRVMAAFRNHRTINCPRFCCTVSGGVLEPKVELISSRVSPAIMFDEGNSVLLMPSGLAAILDDGELDASIAHELSHVLIAKEQGGCTPTWARVIRYSSPVSFVLGRVIFREEEMACDEVAAMVTQSPEALASALLKTYRFRRERHSQMLVTVANLLPARSLLKDRIHHLTHPDILNIPTRFQVALVWCLTILFLFSF